MRRNEGQPTPQVTAVDSRQTVRNLLDSWTTYLGTEFWQTMRLSGISDKRANSIKNRAIESAKSSWDASIPSSLREALGEVTLPSEPQLTSAHPDNIDHRLSAIADPNTPENPQAITK